MSEDDALRPAWRRTPDADAPGPDDDADSLDRGRTVALLAALGRMQMSLDVLARQQRKQHEAVEARLARIERALGEQA